MSDITTRSGKGEPLTHNEVDANFTNLNADKYQAGDNPSFGTITVTGTVDGRDVAADGSKLDGIEALADVTDTANVTAAGALMDSELTSEASVKALDQGVSTTDSPDFAGLTVDTDTLYVDSANNRVGIGTSSPDERLSVQTSAGLFEVRPFGGGSVDLASTGSIRLVGDVAGARLNVEGVDRIVAGGTITTFNLASASEAMRIDSSGNVGIGTSSPSATLDVNGSLSKNSGSFKIDHPVKPDTHHLVHSFVEGPQADNLYRGKVTLVNGSASVNLDEAGRMTEGTFAALNGNVQCWTTNEDGWTQVRGKISGNILTIEAQDPGCTDEISWLVIGERHDQHMIETDWTDKNGRVITEPAKENSDD